VQLLELERAGSYPHGLWQSRIVDASRAIGFNGQAPSIAWSDQNYAAAGADVRYFAFLCHQDR